MMIEKEREKVILFNKKPLFKIFLKQFGDFIGAEIGLLLFGLIYANLTFMLIIQAALILYLLYLLIEKFNKTIIGIEIDFLSQTIKIELINFLGKNKIKTIMFDDFDVMKKAVWVSRYYFFAAVLKEKSNSFAIIPMTGSIWTDAELQSILQEFDKVKTIKNDNFIIGVKGLNSSR